MTRQLFPLFLCCIILIPSNLLGQKKFYWNPFSDNLAGNAANWHAGSCTGLIGLPGKKDSIFFTGCSSPNPDCTVNINLNVAYVELTSAYSGTVTMKGGKKLIFKNGIFKGGVFTGSNGAINANKSLTIEGCNFTACSGSLTVKGSFTFVTGNFSHNNGTIVFKSGSISNNSGISLNLNKLEFQGLGFNFTVNGNVSVYSTLTTSQALSAKINAGNNGGTLELFGDVQWNNTSINYGNVTWKFSGSQTQSFTGAIEPVLYDVVINKTDYLLKLQKGFSVSHQLNLQSGFIVSDSLHPVIILNGATVINASPGSFVRGAVRKVGNSSFQFPVGMGLRFRPIEISAPSAVNDAFIAQYHESEQPFGNKKESSLTYLSKCEYWSLNRTAGNSPVTVKLFWDALTCDIDTLPGLRIARLNSSSKWVNAGNVSIEGDTMNGTIVTQAPQNSFSYYLIAKNSPGPVVNAGNDTMVCAGSSLKLGGYPVATGGRPPYKYEWSPAIYLDTLFRDHPFAILHSTIDYVLTVTDANQITVSDTIHVTVMPVPEVHAGFDRFISFGSNATLATAVPATEGTAPYFYSWSPSIYLNQSNIAQPVSTPLSNITYTLTATDAEGCVGSDDVTLMMSIPATGTAGLFGMLAGDSIITLKPVFVPAWVGSGKFISASVTSDDTIVVNSSLDSAAISDLTSAISQVKEMPGANISSDLGGQSLTSGTYYINGNSTLNSTLTLNGNSESFFIINISNSLTVNGGGITLIGVSRSQVYFRVGGNLRITGTALLPCNFLVEKNISGGIINGASLLTLGKINITDADVKANVYAAELTAVSRTDAGEFFGFNSSNVSYVSQIYPSHFSDHNVRLHMPQLNARIVRWPAGGHAKDWNINDGWFLDPDEVKDSSQYIYSPNISCVAVTPNEAAANLKLPVDRLLDLRFCLGGSDAKMLMCLNMFTNKKFQEDVLKHAVDLGMNFPYIELGNEFYLKGGTCPWVQPEDYAAEASSWLNTIHGNPAFAGIKVGFDGSSWTTEDGITDDDCRRKTWNAGVLPNLTGTRPGDAITFHIYPKTGIAASKIPNVVLEDVPTMFARAFKAIDNFSNNELKTVADYPDLDVWVTEYNLTDKSFIIAGSWAHAMYLSILTMRLLEFPQVKMALCQTFANDAGRGLFFTDARGYKFGSEWATIDSLTETQPWAFTAGGLCVKMITDAMRFSTSAAMLSFPHAPLIPNSEYPVLYGWIFDKDLGDKQSVILNLSDQPQQVDVRALQPANAFEQVSCKNPLLFFTGKVYWNQPYNNFYKAVNYNYSNGTETPANFDSVSAKIPAGTTTIFLPPYSITRLYALNQNTVWFRKSGPKVCAPDNNDYDTAHASTAINIYASGGAYYNWSVMESEPSTASSISISPLAPLSNGILKVYDPEGNLLGTKNNISITHNTLPAVSVTPASFSNKTAASFTATASGAAAYNWTPSFGASGILGNTITINPPNSRNYYVIGTAGNKCSKIEKISTNISPAISIFSAGGELDRRFVPAILFVCRGNMVSLTADGAADAYLWSSSDGSVNGSGVSITFTPSKDVLITVRATDQLNQATSYSSVYVSLRPEVITDQEDYYYCANQFLKLHGELNKESVNTTYAWDDLQPGTKLYEKRNFTKPVAENVFNSSYNSVFFNAPAGDYTMQFKAQDPDYLNCPAVENDYFFNVHLNDAPSIIPPANLCMIRGGTVTLTATGGDHDYTWDGPGLQKSIGASVQVSPEVTSAYKVTTSNNMCCVSASVTVTVENVTAECDGSIYCYGCPGKQVSVSPFDAENYAYQWIENGIAIIGATGESYSIMLTLNETIKESVVQCAIAKNDGTCAPGITNEVRVSVFQNCHYERGESYASENSNDAQSISVSPNPASENFTISFSEENSDDDIAMLEVYDLMGKLFRKDRLNLTDGKYSGNFSQSFPDGMYVVRICTSRGCIATRLVISD